MEKLFWFRTNVADGVAGVMALADTPAAIDSDPVMQELSMGEIFAGGEHFRGLMAYVSRGRRATDDPPQVRDYLDVIDISSDERSQLEEYLQFLENRATGGKRAGASWCSHVNRGAADRSRVDAGVHLEPP